MNAQGHRLLIIDADPQVSEFVGSAAENLGIETVIAFDRSEFVRLLDTYDPTVVVMGLHLRGTDGVELLTILAERSCRASVILISGLDPKVSLTAQRLGEAYGLLVAGTLGKPIVDGDLQRQLSSCLTAREAEVTSDTLRRGIANGDLHVHYQPLVGLNESPPPNTIHAEALMRWKHPVQGMLPPSAFLELAQAAGLLHELTDSVLLTVIRQIRAWERDGIHAYVAVNIPTELADDLEFPDRLIGLLRSEGVEPSRLTLEITEHGVPTDVNNTMHVLSRLRLHGLGLAIDDFGTGHSSLIQLHRMPFNELKIDKSFVQELPESDEARAIVKSVIGLAHDLGVSTCAEGVERPETLEILRELGSERAQGYLLGRPMPPAQLIVAMHVPPLSDYFTITLDHTRSAPRTDRRPAPFGDGDARARGTRRGPLQAQLDAAASTGSPGSDRVFAISDAVREARRARVKTKIDVSMDDHENAVSRVARSTAS